MSISAATFISNRIRAYRGLSGLNNYQVENWYEAFKRALAGLGEGLDISSEIHGNTAGYARELEAKGVDRDTIISVATLLIPEGKA